MSTHTSQSSSVASPLLIAWHCGSLLVDVLSVQLSVLLEEIHLTGFHEFPAVYNSEAELIARLLL
jgi:hypothetical protein